MSSATLNAPNTPQVPLSEPTSSSKKKYEFVWRSMFIVLFIAAAVLLNKVYIFQTHDYFKDIRMGCLTDLLLYGLPFGVLFTIYDLVIHKIFDPLCEKYYITEEKYIEPEQRKKRTYTLVKWGYSIGYYMVSSLWAYKIMKETKFMPTWLGGLGGPESLGEYLPSMPDATFEMKVFYILQFGKHFSRFFSHVFIRSQGNFFEYALHHGLSVFLILFSYLSNQWIIGVFVLLVHDYSDFALILARAYKDYKNYSKKLLDLIYVHAMIAWIFCRIILFCYCCIYSSIFAITNLQLNEFQMSVLLYPYKFMSAMMIGLEILHIFWTYYIAESFVSVKISSKAARHSYD